MNQKFDAFFSGEAKKYLNQAIELALAEDGADLSSLALFAGVHSLTPKHQEETRVKAIIKAKEDTLVVGLPLIPLIMQAAATYNSNYPILNKLKDGTKCALDNNFSYTYIAQEGSLVKSGTVVASITGSASLVLKAERVILNFITHLSGIAKLTSQYVAALAGGKTKLLDTRKTLPTLRYPEKYAVLMGGALNHRKNLEEMLMLKDNHIDASGGITKAVEILRQSYGTACPPIEVECRTLADVKEAASLKVNRIMLDNMLGKAPFKADSFDLLKEALNLIPKGIESELSGGIGLESLGLIAALQPAPDFVSVGKLTHSAPASDFSMLIDFDQTAK